MMVEVLLATGTSESAEDLCRHCHRLRHAAERQADHLPDDPAGRGGSRPRRRRRGEPLVYKRTYHDRLMERIAARREACGPAPPVRRLPGPGRVRHAVRLARARPAALPGQRHRRAVRRRGGRAAGTDTLLRQPRLRRPGRLQDVLQDDGHRANPARERGRGRVAAGVRRRLRGDPEHEGGGRHRRGRGQRRGRPQRQARRLETRPADRRRRRPGDPGFPRGRPAGRLSLRADTHALQAVRPISPDAQAAGRAGARPRARLPRLSGQPIPALRATAPCRSSRSASARRPGAAARSS